MEKPENSNAGSLDALVMQLADKWDERVKLYEGAIKDPVTDTTGSNGRNWARSSEIALCRKEMLEALLHNADLRHRADSAASNTKGMTDEK